MLNRVARIFGGGPNEEEFAKLYDEHSARVRRIVSRLSPTREGVDDLVQETFVKAWKAYPTLTKQESLKAWISQIAVNTARDGLRAMRSRKEKDKVSIDDEETLLRPELSQAPMQGEGADDRALVEAALNQLSFDHRSVVVMHLYEGLSMEEVGKALSIPSGTVKSRYFHAKKIMKLFLASQGVAGVSGADENEEEEV